MIIPSVSWKIWSEVDCKRRSEKEKREKMKIKERFSVRGRHNVLVVFYILYSTFILIFRNVCCNLSWVYIGGFVCLFVFGYVHLES